MRKQFMSLPLDFSAWGWVAFGAGRLSHSRQMRTQYEDRSANTGIKTEQKWIVETRHILFSGKRAVNTL